jgi:uncharacterized protein (TIGR03435 family)
MELDDKNASKIDHLLYDALQLPPQEAVEEDCDRALAYIRQEAQFRSFHERRAPIPPQSAATRWRLFFVPAAAAVLLAVFIGSMWKQEVFRTSGTRELKAGEAFRSDANPTSVTLTDGSKLELRADADGVIESASDGLRIRLNAGSLIVHAAKQMEGRSLYVQTKDLSVSVVGTIFLVQADERGSQVAVIEGEVRVRKGSEERTLQRGDSVPASEKLAELPAFDKTGWSREAAAYLAMLHESMARSLAAKQSSSRGAAASGKPRFDEASIQRCEQEFPRVGRGGGGSGSFRFSPGRLDALCMNVVTLIRMAFPSPLKNSASSVNFEEAPRMSNASIGTGSGEDGRRVRGGPDWVRSEKYTIVAMGEASPDVSILQAMLMELLERRFKLKFRINTEEIPVYALTIAKDGLKLKPEEGTCSVEALRRNEQHWGTQTRNLSSEELRTFDPPECRIGQNFEFTRGPNLKYTFGRQPLRTIAEWLSGMFFMAHPGGVPVPGLNGDVVVDRTGIPDTQLFSLVVEVAANPDWVSRAFGDAFGSGPQAPNIFDALGKFGLKLERSRDLREYIFIEDIERPSPN